MTPSDRSAAAPVKAMAGRVPGLRRLVRAGRDRANRVATDLVRRRVMARDGHEILVVFGMRRSGNHLLVNWMLEQNDGCAAFYNNIDPRRAPFTARMVEHRIRFPDRTPRLVLSYEDVRPGRILDGPLGGVLARQADRHGARVRFALILRDPYNLFASRLKKWPDRFETPESIAAQQALYAEHAALAAAPAPIWRDAPLVPVLYNCFVAEAEARRTLSKALDLRAGDRGLDRVPVYGHGSSFDGTGAAGVDPVRDRVFTRWRTAADDPRFRSALAAPALRDAARDLFGMAAPDAAAD